MEILKLIEKLNKEKIEYILETKEDTWSMVIFTGVIEMSGVNLNNNYSKEDLEEVYKEIEICISLRKRKEELTKQLNEQYKKSFEDFRNSLSNLDDQDLVDFLPNTIS